VWHPRSKKMAAIRNEADARFGNVSTVTQCVKDGQETAELIVAQNAGGSAVSWKVNGVENFYMVPQCQFAPGKTPFRGGVPICWPSFATRNPKVGKHGFARQSAEWQMVAEKNDGKVGSVELELICSAAEVLGEPAGEQDKKDVRFSTIYEICGRVLRQSLRVENGSTRDVSFTTCLHTYFLFEQGGISVDVPAGWSQFREPIISPESKVTDNEATRPAGAIAIGSAREVERIYFDVPMGADAAPVVMTGKGADGQVKRLEFLRSESMPHVVVWNIGDNAGSRPKDLPQEDVDRYVCVEPGVCEEAVVVPAGKSWEGWQLLSSR